MDDFLKSSTFVLEELQAEKGEPFCNTIDLKLLHDNYISKKKARITREGSLGSVVVKESNQLDVNTLPCGARSLLIDPTTGTVHVRGVNKFLSISNVGLSFIEDNLCDNFEVYIQRKMAGFCVSVFSPDGEKLSVMSKHSASGPHCQLAERILKSCATLESQKLMAQDLYRLGATATCECIAIAEDFGHPVLEPERFDNQLIMFSIQRNQVAERGLPPPQVASFAKRWGIQAAPMLRVHNSKDLLNIISHISYSWAPKVLFEHTDLKDTEELAEGVVIVMRKISSPSRITKTWEQDEEPDDTMLEWKKSFRLKVKTIKYIMLRNLRSRILEGFQRRSFFIQRVIVEWANSAASGLNVNGDIEKFVFLHGIWSLWTSFEKFFLREASDSSCPLENHASGNALTSGDERCFSVREAYQQLINQTVKEVVQEGIKIKDKNNPAPITLVVLCGLPGSGKSTFADTFMNQLRVSLKPRNFAVGVTIHRDMVHRRMMDGQPGLDPAEDRMEPAALSKVQVQNVKQQVHHEIIDIFDRICQLSCFLDDGDGKSETANHSGIVVVLDACNSTPSTRRVWRDVLPPSIDAFLIVHLLCSEENEVDKRLHRPSHERLQDAVEAQRALDTVKKIFVPPNVTEQEDAMVLEFDTCNSTAEECSEEVIERIFQLHKESALRRGPRENSNDTTRNAMKVLDGSVEELQKELDCRSHSLLSSLLNIDHFSPSTLELFDHQKRSKKENDGGALVQLRIEDSQWHGIECELFQRLLCLLKNTESDSDVVIFGQKRWLSGCLFGPDGVAQATETSLRNAFRARFSVAARCPHVSLLDYFKSSGSSNSSGDLLDSFLEVSQLQIGQHIHGRITEILIDPNAWVLVVELFTDKDSVRRTTWNCDVEDNTVTEERKEEEEMNPAPLHITMGRAAVVEYSYTGTMPFQFQKWEKEKEELEKEKQLMQSKKGGKKGRVRVHNNALHVRLTPPLPFDGVVESF